MNAPKFPRRALRRFVETVGEELGIEQLNVMLSLSKLPGEWSKPGTFAKTDPAEAARVYGSLQSAMRTYYGRGARGLLNRVGGRLWHHLLEDAAFGAKAQASLIKRLPMAARRKGTLELLGRFIGVDAGDITVHTLDLDLLLADHASPTADGQSSSSPVCFVTQGLVRGSLFWASGINYDVQETSCKAMAEEACEFTITGGK